MLKHGAKINIAPLSVNRAWQGRRFKTAEYKQYEKDLLWLLPKMAIPDPPYCLSVSFGLSNALADFDNPVKPFVDVLQKKYGFNDKLIDMAVVTKVKVPKGHEFIDFEISTIKEV